MQTPIDYIISPGGKLSGEILVPGDKSISHRALMLSAIANGVSHIQGFLAGEDTLATARALQQMGVRIEHHSSTELTVHGVGMHGLVSPDVQIDLGNSGTSTRLFCGILSGAGVECEIIGDASLMTRPMGRIVEPLQSMQANISSSPSGTLPIHIQKSPALKSIEYTLPVASAQLKSCLLLAGLYAEGITRLTEPAVSRDHTERMLDAFGVSLERNGLSCAIEGGQVLSACDITVPADISSATFFIVGALIAEGSDITLKNVGINPSRDAVLTILNLMGANIETLNRRNLGGEPVADIRVQYSQLHGIEIPEELVPIAIDEFPAILVAAATASGSTRLSGAAELRVKESDRLAAMAAGLKAIGIRLEEKPDGMLLEGGELTGGDVNSFTDHRIAMAFSMAALAAAGPIRVKDCANVATSFPGFEKLANAAGLALRV